ncbi:MULTISPECIES: hypothetical protein [unclassified Mameliella]|uniref:hypothetical protein n=1 Tax=unclassified Mameliella TaxID=2630630 RepID=UPI00273F2F18|nr:MULTISPECIES: hypothetical protein [unclassified Mameliella]
MTTTLTTAARNAACNAIADLVDAGTTDANGDLVIYTSGDSEVATLALTNPAFGNAASGVCTAAAISDDSSATGGTASYFTLQDRDNTEVIRGDCGTSGAELNLSSLSIGATDTVSVSSLTLTVPATDA